MSELDKPSSSPSRLIPPSLTQDLFSRRVIVACFWAVALLGVPIWWQATNIERLPLASNEVLEWVKAGECPVRPTINLKVQMGRDGQEGLVSSLENRLASIPAANCLDFRIRASGDDQDILASDFVIEVKNVGKTVLSGRRASVARTGVNDEDAIFDAAKTLLGLDAPLVDPRVVKFASRYRLSFTLLNQDSTKGGALLEWDVEHLIKSRLEPLLRSLSPLHDFTVESQIQYFAPLSIEAKKEDGLTLIEEDDLRAFVNSADWNIVPPASSVTMDTTLHFLLYVPDVDNRPMRIRTASGSLDSSNAFITPQWGGVVIYNPPIEEKADSSDSLDYAFLLFEQQFQRLFGVSQTGHRGALSQWQVDALVRRRLMEAVKESVDTLEAIIKLAEEIPNMRIGKEVQRGVRSSLNELEAARLALSTAPDVALRHAAAALELASKAYFNPTMLALLYFPDEHKYAVYTPLFGPIAVPMVAALLKEFKEWKEKRRKKREAKAKVE